MKKPLDESELGHAMLSLLQRKLEAIADYERSIDACHKAHDARCRQLFEDLKREDVKHADLLCAEVNRLVREGKLGEGSQPVRRLGEQLAGHSIGAP